MPFLSFISDKTKNVIYTGALTALFGWAGSYFWLGLGGTFPVLGFEVPTPIGIALVTGLSAVVGEIGNNYILPMLPASMFLTQYGTYIIGPAVTAGVAYEYVNFFGNAGDVGAIGGSNLLMLGFGSHLLATVTSPMIAKYI